MTRLCLGLLVALPALALTATAHAQATTPAFGGDIVHGPRWPEAGVSEATSVSHVIYLNDCMPDGCTLHPGFDDSRTDYSSIPNQLVVLPAYPWGDQHWADLVDRVRLIYEPFDIQITTEDPGDADHFEVMVGGVSDDIGVHNAGGVAPFIPCNGFLDDNVISFVFAETSNDLDYLSGAVAQETAHVFGLDHELWSPDAMTYLDLGSSKTFTDHEADCGEALSDPRECWCGGTSQNSYAYLMDLFGSAVPVAPEVEILAPADGAWVVPGFPIRARVDSPTSGLSSRLEIDGTEGATATGDTLIANGPLDLTPGEHTIVVYGTNVFELEASASITVNVVGTCADDAAACGDGFACLGGYCLPDASVDGGLGATCGDGVACLFGSCGMADGEAVCTETCDEGSVCPDGYYCRPSGSSEVCWPGSEGGCNAGGGRAPVAALLGLVGLALITRRRARARR